MTRHAPTCLLELLLLTGAVLGLVGLSSGGAGTDDGIQATVEGQLCSSAALFNPPRDAVKQKWTDQRDDEALARGLPAGILAGEKFTLLLVDGRLLARLPHNRPGGPIRIRATGLRHDEGRCLTPLKLEYQDGDRWIVFDLPLSGSAGPASLRGDE
jgi:hypothetical protein